MSLRSLTRFSAESAALVGAGRQRILPLRWPRGLLQRRAKGANDSSTLCHHRKLMAAQDHVQWPCRQASASMSRSFATPTGSGRQSHAQYLKAQRKAPWRRYSARSAPVMDDQSIDIVTTPRPHWHALRCHLGIARPARTSTSNRLVTTSLLGPPPFSQRLAATTALRRPHAAAQPGHSRRDCLRSFRQDRTVTWRRGTCYSCGASIGTL